MADELEHDPGTTPLLHELFDRAAAAHAGRVAIDVAPGPTRGERRVVTYAELRGASESIAGRLAARLDAAPPEPAEPLVAMHLGRECPGLYAAQLAALRAGAAFTCLDPRVPDGHVRSVIADARPAAIVADAAGRARLAAMGVDPTLVVEVDGMCRRDAGPAPAGRGGVRDPTRLAYVIYTSGTTGAPKGVMIEHRSIVNLVRSDVARFGLGPGDRVAQCSSPAYDSSIEETWLAFAVGATLVPLDDETVRLGPDLVPWLRTERISVLCPPPTLLRTTGCADPRAALPDLRLLYVGGEALPQDLADLWGAGRRLENGYGPTECTVTVLRSHVRPGRTVTIGRPVEGHRAWIVDETLAETADGTPGELVIGGIGLARGYRGLDRLTAERFPTHPRFGRVYRTGDLVRRNAEGEVEYLGRIDSQVKLRGHRVELGAVDAALAGLPGVRAAACRVQSNGSHGDHPDVLVAHVVPDPTVSPPTAESLRRALLEIVPEHMVPARFAFTDALPTSVGGKLDRRRLPEIDMDGAAPERRHDAPRSPLEACVADAFRSALRLGRAPGVAEDFFIDLGGDSLGAVAVVCALRAADGIGVDHVTVRDVYDARTAAALAARLEEGRGRPRLRSRRAVGEPPRGAAPLSSTLVQAAFLLATAVGAGAATYLACFRLGPWLLGAVGPAAALLVAPGIALIALAGYAAATIGLLVAAKRLLVGRYEPGRVAVWSAAWTRHWIVTHAARLVPWWLLEGTVFHGDLLRALGARIGRRVHIHRGVDLRRGGWDLLELGDDATLSQDVHVGVVELDEGHAVFGRVVVGAGATIGVRAGLSPGAVVGPSASLTALSWLPPGATVPPGERWDGVPAVRVADPASGPPAGPATDAPPPCSSMPPRLHGSLMIAARLGQGLLAASPALVAAAIAVTAAPEAFGRGGEHLLAWLRDPTRSWTALAALAAATTAATPVSLLVQALALRITGAAATGVVGRWSLAYVRIWLRTGAVEGAGRWLSGTLFWPLWLRLAGMRIGRNCEISTIIDVLPESVAIGDECFLADGIYLCSPRIERGLVTMARTTIGGGTFLGNHAVVDAGHDWPPGLFVGVATAADDGLARNLVRRRVAGGAPHTDAQGAEEPVAPEPGAPEPRVVGRREREDPGWFGHPPMALPRREIVRGDRRLTHEPSAIRRINRLLWESARFTLPLVPLAVGLAWYGAVAEVEARRGGGFVVGVVAGAATLGGAAALCGAALALKWLLLGRVRPGQHALWSCWCSRWDFLYVAWGFWSRGALAFLEGTLLLNAFLRLVGMRIGRRVVLGEGFAHVVDPDMLEFGDDATVACQFQAHSFEDRILKIDRLHIGAGASVGANTVVFYGVEVGPGARVEPQGVVMKRDVLEAGRTYVGCPTREASTVGAGFGGV